MIRDILIAGLIFLLSTSAWTGQDLDHEEARDLRAQGLILPLTQIIQQAEQAGLETILEVELEKEQDGWIYEIEGLTKHYQLIELTIDARTGNVIATEFKKRHHRKHD